MSRKAHKKSRRNAKNRKYKRVEHLVRLRKRLLKENKLEEANEIDFLIRSHGVIV